MIAIARKNLPCLFPNPNLFLCNSNVHLFPSIHFFSTWRIKRLIPSPEMYDVLVHKHRFSPELASLAASRLPKFRSPKKVDSMLKYLKENSFTTSQLEKILKCNPRILGMTIEGLKFKFKVFEDLGLSSEEIAKITSSNLSIFRTSTVHRIIPSLSVLKGLLGSNPNVVRLVRKSAWFLSSDLKKTLIPNVEILKSCGIPLERILNLIYTYPRCFLIKPEMMRKSVDKAIDIGVSLNSVKFINAANVYACTSERMLEVRRQALQDMGFSVSDLLKMFRKQPTVFCSSMEKTKKVVDLLLATGKYNISDIVTNPTSLGCSVEKRLEPRLQILGLLESRNLIEKWPGLGRVAAFTDDKFFDTFVRPYYDEIGEECIIKKYVKGKKELKPFADEL